MAINWEDVKLKKLFYVETRLKKSIKPIYDRFGSFAEVFNCFLSEFSVFLYKMVLNSKDLKVTN